MRTERGGAWASERVQLTCGSFSPLLRSASWRRPASAATVSKRRGGSGERVSMYRAARTVCLSQEQRAASRKASPLTLVSVPFEYDEALCSRRSLFSLRASIWSATDGPSRSLILAGIRQAATLARLRPPATSDYPRLSLRQSFSFTRENLSSVSAFARGSKLMGGNLSQDFLERSKRAFELIAFGVGRK